MHRVGVVESTQDIAHRLAAEGAPDGTVVVAEEQSRGRGTRGRDWSAPRGGLWLTVLLRPQAAPAVEGLSLRVGMGVAAALDPHLAEPLRLKWPNDLIGADRKAGGILCEARWMGDTPGWVAVGVGLNVANRIPPTLAFVSSRLADLGCALGPEDLLDPVVAAIRAAGRLAGPLSATEQDEFARRDWLRGRDLRLPVPGRAAGITPDGRLLVETEAGDRVPVLGSVTLAGLAPDDGSR